MSSLYILGINLLSVASFSCIFSHSKGHLFVSLMASFAVQKLLSLIRSHMFIFAFVSLTFELIHKDIAKTAVSEVKTYVFY